MKSPIVAPLWSRYPRDISNVVPLWSRHPRDIPIVASLRSRHPCDISTVAPLWTRYPRDISIVAPLRPSLAWRLLPPLRFGHGTHMASPPEHHFARHLPCFPTIVPLQPDIVVYSPATGATRTAQHPRSSPLSLVPPPGSPSETFPKRLRPAAAASPSRRRFA
jgi:hypothetical protein